MNKIRNIKEKILEIIEEVMCFITHTKELANLIFFKRQIRGTEYNDLAPIDEVPECKEHINAMEWAFSNSDRIKNIALAGPYGSGKSSIINAFLQKNPLIKDKSVRISLATFTGGEVKGRGSSKTIEKGILKQLFYKVEQREIPQSRYRKLHRIGFIRVFTMIALSLLVVSIITFVFSPQLIDNGYELVKNAAGKLHMSDKIAFCILALIAAFVTYMMAKFVQLIVAKISIVEINISSNAKIKGDVTKQESIFDRNIDEIVYFFEETRYSVVFFEDLDRFEDPQIFIQLREINTLLNNYDAIKRPIIFVYAIQDDIFTDIDRTKFFDFIIPVIPVINSTNSGEILLNMLKTDDGESVKHNISLNYILDVSPYISDMRVLRNIYNEFVMYKETLKRGQGLALNDEIMMSLIIFKNIYPHHFADLQNESGIVKAAFDDKDVFVNRKQDELEEKIKEKTRTLDNIDADVLNGVREVKSAMLAEIANWSGCTYRINYRVGAYSEKSLDSATIIGDDFDFSELLNLDTADIYYYSYAGGNSQHLQKDSVGEIFTQYYKRVEYLKDSSKDRKERIKKEIRGLTEQKHMIVTYSLQNLINEFDVADLFSTAEIKDNDLLVFMLRKGYINENYADYMNFFKGNSITTADKNYILSVKNQKPMPYTYSLNKTEQILQRLQDHEFTEKAILNFDLLELMLKNCKKDDIKLVNYIQQLSNGEPYAWNFIDEFIDRTENERNFVKLLAANWHGLWDFIFNSSSLTYEQKIKYLERILYYLDLENITALNQNKLITKFFEENDNILVDLSNTVLDRVIQIIPELNIKFKRLQLTGVPTKVIDFIFDNCYYDLNEDMITGIVEYKVGGPCDGLKTQNYTEILELDYDKLLMYVHDNIENYIDTIVLRENNVDESVHAILELLERMIDDFERCKKIIAHEKFTVESILSVCSSYIETEWDFVRKVWDCIIINGKMSVSWENIFNYWEEAGFNEVIIGFITSNLDELIKLDNACLNDAFKEDGIMNNFDIATFSKLLTCFKMEQFNVPLKDLSEEKLRIMIQQNYLQFSNDTYNELAEAVPDLCTDFILHNQDIYHKIIDDVSLDESVFESLIVNGKMDIAIKQHLVNRDGVEMMTPEVADIVAEIDVKLCKEALSVVWNQLNSPDKRRSLLYKHIDVIERDEFEVYFDGLEEPYNAFTRETSRHDEYIPDTPENRMLAERLHQIKYITSYKFEEGIHKRGPEKQERGSFIRCRVKAK